MGGLEITLVIIGIVASIFGNKWRKTSILLKEIGEFCLTTSEAMEDNKITKEEASDILGEVGDVILAGKNLLK